MAANVERIDNYGKLKSIEAPDTDVLTFCKQFTLDFMSVLDNIVDEREEEIPKTSLKEKLLSVENALQNGFIPDEFRDLGIKMISEVLEQVPLDFLDADFTPIADIKKQIAEIRAQCQGKWA